MVEKAQREFWCRTKNSETSVASTTRAVFPNMHAGYAEIPVRLLQRMSKLDVKKMGLPPSPGIVTYVATTGHSIIIEGCSMKDHALYSNDPTSADRFVKLKSTSILLVPIYDHVFDAPIGVLQVNGLLSIL